MSDSSPSLVLSEFQPTLVQPTDSGHTTVDSDVDHHQQAIGFVAITFQSAHVSHRASSVWRRWLWMKPSPFVVVGFEEGDEFALTTYRRNTNDPNWIKQTKYLVVPPSRPYPKLDINMYSRRRLACMRHKWLGSATVDFNPDPSPEDMIDWEAKRVVLTNKHDVQVAEMLVNVIFRPVLSNGSSDALPPPPVGEKGIVNLVLASAEDLDEAAESVISLVPASRAKRGRLVAQVNFCPPGGPESTLFKASARRHDGSGSRVTWAVGHLFVCEGEGKVTVTVRRQEDSQSVGSLTVELQDLFKVNGQKESGNMWSLMGTPSQRGRISMWAEWQSVQ